MDILRTKRLTLRTPLEVDAEQITKAISNKNVSRNLSGTPYPYTLSDANDWIKWTRRHPFVYTIHRQRLAGVVRIREGAEAPILGFWLDEPFWSKGYMNEAVQVVLAKAFESGVSKIASNVFADNEAAIAILQKNGFGVVGEGKSFCPARGESFPTTKTMIRRDEYLTRIVGETQNDKAA